MELISMSRCITHSASTDVLNEVKFESDKVREHLPDFFEKLREEPTQELRDKKEHKAVDQDNLLPQVPNEFGLPTANIGLLVAYRTITETSIPTSIQS